MSPEEFDIRKFIQDPAGVYCLHCLEDHWANYFDSYGRSDYGTLPGILKVDSGSEENSCKNTSFKDFIKDYSVGRTIKSGKIDQLSEHLRNDFYSGWSKFKDCDPENVGRMSHMLHETFSAKETPAGLLSCMSKVAHFCRPDFYTPIDRYAVAGANLFSWPKSSRHVDCAFSKRYMNFYSKFEEIHSAWQPVLRGPATKFAQRGVEKIVNGPIDFHSHHEKAAVRCMVDIVLMLIGGRSFGNGQLGSGKRETFWEFVYAIRR